MALQKLLNDKYKLESLQGDGSRIRPEIPQTAGCKARACNCCIIESFYDEVLAGIVVVIFLHYESSFHSSWLIRCMWLLESSCYRAKANHVGMLDCSRTECVRWSCFTGRSFANAFCFHWKALVLRCMACTPCLVSEVFVLLPYGPHWLFLLLRHLIYLFLSRHEVYSMNTHNLQDAGWQKETKQNVVQGIEARGITGLQTLLATALKTEP